MDRITDISFYRQSAIELAQQLIGVTIVRKKNENIIERYTITATEAYCGEEDKACHAHKGRTKRTEIMYADGGCIYVYLIYGIHWMFNIVAENKEHPEAVLICGLNKIKGSGRVGKTLEIDKSFYGEDLITSNRIWLEKGNSKLKHKSMPRQGIDYAKDWKDKPLRFESIDYFHNDLSK